MSSQSSLQAGIHAFKAGDKVAARAHLMQAVEADETDEQAWLWLAGVMDDPAETRICLDNVLHLNPANERAKQGLAWLQKQHPALFAVEPSAPPAPPVVGAAPAPIVPVVGATMTLADLAALPPDPPAPAVGPTYHVPRADDGVSLAGAANIQPCPRCGKLTKLAERRCRACGMSLMVRVEREQQSRAIVLAAGVMSTIHAVLVFLLGVGLLILLISSWNRIKKEMLADVLPEQRAAYLEQYQPMLDEFYTKAFEPAINATALLAMVGIIGIILSVGILRTRRWAYWLGWLYNGFFWLNYLALFVYVDRILDFIQLFVAGQATPTQIKRFVTIMRGIGLFPALYFTILIVCLAFAWRLFTRESIRFIAPTIETGDASDYFNRGVNYRKRGMWYQSMVEWQRAVQISPEDATYRHALGLVYDQMKRPLEARHELAEAQRLDPNNMAIMQDAQRLGALQ